HREIPPEGAPYERHCLSCRPDRDRDVHPVRRRTPVEEAAMAVSDLPVSVPVAVTADGPAFQWGPVLLGALGASAISMVLLAFGSGIGLSAVSAEPYAGASAKALAVI